MNNDPEHKIDNILLQLETIQNKVNDIVSEEDIKSLETNIFGALDELAIAIGELNNEIDTEENNVL